MKVFAWIKIRDGLAGKSGDIIYFYPTVEDQGKKTLIHFFPVLVDIIIPCGDAFQKVDFHCTRCEWNDPESCGVIKYTRGVWSAGDVQNPPRVIQKRKYMIDRSQFIDAEKEALIGKEDKTEAEKTTIIQDAIDNEQLKTVLVEKEIKAKIK